MCIPTHNNLEYLKLCLKSLNKHSVLDNQICIHVDGSTDGTIDWLKKAGYSYTIDEWIGTYTSWNRAAKRATKDFLILAMDDLYFGPAWDINLRRWVRKDRILTPRLVEPTEGSFPPPCDCGRTFQDFDEDKFIKYVKEISRHELKPHGFGVLTLHKDVFWDVGGFDPICDPIACGTADLLMMLHEKHPELRHFQALDVIVYHFQRKAVVKIPNKQELDDRAVRRFEEKWGMSLDAAFGLMRRNFQRTTEG